MLPDEIIKLTQADGYITKVYAQYSKSKDLLGSVVILHGMTEHHNRYLRFADYLNEQGYDVYMYDHRGHGLDKKLEELGYIADHNGSDILINDGIEVLEYVHKNKRTEKLILFSHSMGSLVGRNIIQRYDKMDKAIFMGTANAPTMTSRFGLALTGLIQKFKGAKHHSKFLQKNMFETKAYRKLCERTAYDWLTRNNAVVGAYIDDPYCGFPASVSFLHDIVYLTYQAGLEKNTNRTRKDLPVLFISGTCDPVGNYGKDVTRIFNQFQRQGYKTVDCILYKDSRHELLLELNYNEVMQDLVNWIQSY